MLILSLLSVRCPALRPSLLGRPSASLPLQRYRRFSSRVKSQALESETELPLYRCEGLFAVNKPLEWTSQDVVSYIRGILERDARNRGAKPAKLTDRRNKNRAVRVGHGGTLDPLATGVLVIGVGKGTKELQRCVWTGATVRNRSANVIVSLSLDGFRCSYLQGDKGYRAGGEFGFETTTLDMEGNVTRRGSYDHITREAVENVIANELTGTIQQIPPIFSAIRKNGKRLYADAREGKSAEDMDIEPREVEVLSFQLLNFDLPKFDIDIMCGGGTYVRSLVRDIGYKVGSVATTTYLERTKQGPFQLQDTLAKEAWNADNIYAAIETFNTAREKE